MLFSPKPRSVAKFLWTIAPILAECHSSQPGQEFVHQQVQVFWQSQPVPYAGSLYRHVSLAVAVLGCVGFDGPHLNMATTNVATVPCTSCDNLVMIEGEYIYIYIFIYIYIYIYHMET